MKRLKLMDGNWGLKLLALALAIILYQTLKNKTENSDKKHDRPILQTR